MANSFLTFRTFLIFCIMITSNILFAQELRSSLFKGVDELYKQASELNAQFLSPTNFETAMEYYREAEAGLNEGDDLDDIRGSIFQAEKYLNNSINIAKIGNVSLEQVLQARSDAESSGAPEYSNETWNEAEELFRSAAEELEDNSLTSAKETGLEAENKYRESELLAIKANYLNETKSLLQRAEDMSVEDYAPKTLQKSKELITDAERELTENRYDTDYPRDLARIAKYEAMHALYLTNFALDWEDKDKTKEDIILLSEQPLSKIAGRYDIVAEFHKGYDQTTNDIIKFVDNKLDVIEQLTQENTDLSSEIEEYKKQVAEYEEKLGGIASEQSKLQERLAEIEQNKERYNRINGIFLPSEANVTRDGNNIIIRLISLSFNVGKSDIQSEHYTLLSKVQKAVNVFPNSSIIIEGHTDSYGSDERNLELSKVRAEAVYNYMFANSGVEKKRLSAIGYGESKPIANNETKEGRTKNRRIDIVIIPNS